MKEEKPIYQIKTGEISFDEESIVINDNAKRQYLYQILLTILYVFYGVICH